MVNVHFSLLPRWRGAAPLERAILAGDRETGICLMKVEAGLDTGPVYAVRAVPIDDEITLADLRARLVDVACSLLVDELADGLAGLPEPEPQRGDADDRGQDHQGGPPSRLVPTGGRAQPGRAPRARLDDVPG